MTQDPWISDLWREACLATDIAALAVKAVDLCAADHPLAALTVLALDLQDDSLEVVAAAGQGDLIATVGARAALTADQADAWRQLLRASADSALAPALALPADPHIRDPLGALLPGDLPAHGLALPLAGGDRAVGLALLVPGEGARGPQAHADLLGCREPLAAALQNELRVRELVAGRRSAEAHAQSLLNRLGRDKVLERIVGDQGGLRSVMQRVQMVAASDLPVLVLGETGSGKEVIARAVHERSNRASGPFTRVNCGAVPPELIDSELFGHEKGSFTGAVGRRLGWFERSDGGTLLLDEIGELPKAAQVRLLRVLQDGTIQRVGGEQTVHVDVRIIAATHRDLAAMVRTGEFREDLWYRLAVFPLLLPPLRDRRQDIPALVDMLVGRAARRFGVRPQSLQPRDLALLLDYPWPGNVRELGSVIDRAVILGEGRRLEIAKALGAFGRGGPAARSGPPGRHPAVAGPTATDPDLAPLDEVVVRHIELALAACQGKVSGTGGAAALLGLNANTLRSKLRKHGIAPAAFRTGGRARR